MFSANAHVCPFGNSGMPQEEATKSAQFVKHLFFFFKHTVALYYIHLIFPVDQGIFLSFLISFLIEMKRGKP